MSHQVGPVAIMIICKHIKLSPTLLRKSFQRCCAENDQMSTGGVHKTVPENRQIRKTQIQLLIRLIISSHFNFSNCSQ